MARATLVGTISLRTGPGAGPVRGVGLVLLPVSPEAVATWGYDLDGANYPLQGQPPPATTKGWGIVPGTPLPQQ